jgi:hypothetical protein
MLGDEELMVLVGTSSIERGVMSGSPYFLLLFCVRFAYVISAGVGFRVESGAVALLQLDL